MDRSMTREDAWRAVPSSNHDAAWKQVEPCRPRICSATDVEKADPSSKLSGQW